MKSLKIFSVYLVNQFEHSKRHKQLLQKTAPSLIKYGSSPPTIDSDRFGSNSRSGSNLDLGLQRSGPESSYQEVSQTNVNL